jgi:hypothetical protein
MYGLFTESRQLFTESRQLFTESRQLFTESRQLFTESRQLFTESRWRGMYGLFHASNESPQGCGSLEAPVSTNRTLGCVKPYCLTGRSMIMNVNICISHVIVCKLPVHMCKLHVVVCKLHVTLYKLHGITCELPIILWLPHDVLFFGLQNKVVADRKFNTRATTNAFMGFGAVQRVSEWVRFLTIAKDSFEIP